MLTTMETKINNFLLLFMIFIYTIYRQDLIKEVKKVSMIGKTIDLM